MQAAHDIGAQSLPGIVYTPRSETTRETEVAALANLYSFVIKSSQAKGKAGGSNGSDNDAGEERR
jgi:hypothetical protein